MLEAGVGGRCAVSEGVEGWVVLSDRDSARVFRVRGAKWDRVMRAVRCQTAKRSVQVAR